jgi:hypothetical protein
VSCRLPNMPGYAEDGFQGSTGVRQGARLVAGAHIRRQPRSLARQDGRQHSSRRERNVIQRARQSEDVRTPPSILLRGPLGSVLGGFGVLELSQDALLHTGRHMPSAARDSSTSRGKLGQGTQTCSWDLEPVRCAASPVSVEWAYLFRNSATRAVRRCARRAGTFRAAGLP